MKTTKMSLVNIQGKLSRAEMKNIMAGSGGGKNCGFGHFPCANSQECRAINKGECNTQGCCTL